MPAYDLGGKYASLRGYPHLRSRCSQAKYNLAKSLLRNRENRLGAGPVTSRESSPHMLSRDCINRITLLMHYFIITLGMMITTFAAWYGTCTWCGCVFLYNAINYIPIKLNLLAL